jgi:hypothetical protein
MNSWSNSDEPPASTFVPEKRLLAAVLQRAITDYLTGDGELKESARLWILENEDSDSPISFLFICEALDLVSDGLRRAIIAHSNVVAVAGEKGAQSGAKFNGNNIPIFNLTEKFSAQAAAV